MTKKRVKLNQWYFCTSLRTIGDGAKLYGIAENHPAFEENEPIVTSPLLEFDTRSRTAESKNTIYELGLMEEGFRKYLRENRYTLADYEKAIKESK